MISDGRTKRSFKRKTKTKSFYELVCYEPRFYKTHRVLEEMSLKTPQRARCMRAPRSKQIRIASLLAFLALFTSTSTQLFGFYAGGSLSYHFVMPSIYWSNVVKNHWMMHNKARADAAMGDWNASLLTVKPEMTFQQDKLEAASPEVLLLEQKYKGAVGGAFYVGATKLYENRFCYGAELKFVIKGVSVKREEQNKELLNADDAFIVYQMHHLVGKVTYSMNIEYHKNFELSGSIRLGYFPTNRIMPYVKLGGAAHQNEYKHLRIDTATTLGHERFDDDAYLEYFLSTYLKAMKASIYSVPKKTQWYASINIGTGADYFISRKVFTRLEYEFKIAFSSRSSTLSGVNVDEDIYKAYGLRYQDKEHCLSLGIGVYL